MYENRQVREVGQLLKCDMEKGLSHGEAAGRLKQYGKNALKEQKQKTKFALFMEQLRGDRHIPVFGGDGGCHDYCGGHRGECLCRGDSGREGQKGD